MPRNAKTVLGWGTLEPLGRAPLPHQRRPEQTQVMDPLPVTPPPMTIYPRRSRRPRQQQQQQQQQQRPHSVPGYRASPLSPQSQSQSRSLPLPLPPVLPLLPDPQPPEAQPPEPWCDAAPTVCDLPILDTDTPATARRSSHARALETTHFQLLGAILLHVAGLLAHDDPELHTEGAIALYASAALMLWCMIRMIICARR